MLSPAPLLITSPTTMSPNRNSRRAILRARSTDIEVPSTRFVAILATEPHENLTGFCVVAGGRREDLAEAPCRRRRQNRLQKSGQDARAAQQPAIGCLDARAGLFVQFLAQQLGVALVVADAGVAVAE